MSSTLQVYFQRVLSAKTTRFAEILSYIAGAGCIFMTIPAMLIGIIATQTSVYTLCNILKSDLILCVVFKRPYSLNIYLH